MITRLTFSNLLKRIIIPQARYKLQHKTLATVRTRKYNFRLEKIVLKRPIYTLNCKRKLQFRGNIW